MLLQSGTLVGETAAANGVGDHVINRRMNMGDAMMLGRGRCREGDAENNCGGKRNFCLAQHFCLLVELRRQTPNGLAVANAGRDTENISVIPSSN